MKLEQKYHALIKEAQQRKMPNVEGIRLCFQTLSLAAGIDRDCAVLLAPHGLSEGRFVLLFLLDAAADGLAPNTLAEQAGLTAELGLFTLGKNIDHPELAVISGAANDPAGAHPVDGLGQQAKALAANLLDRGIQQQFKFRTERID